MEPWIGTLITALVASTVTAGGIIATYLVQRRAARTQERQAQVEESSSLVTQWQQWADEQSKARKETEAEVKELRGDVREARREVEDLRHQFRRLEGRLMAAIEYIRRMLAWAAEVTHATPHPALPDDIADLINTKPGGTS
jgi:septal ring factor EnvC (AmiA/AmiB activator)